MPPISPSRQIIMDLNIDSTELSEIIGCTRGHLTRYTTGDKKISTAARLRIFTRYGSSITPLLDAIDVAVANQPARSGKPGLRSKEYVRPKGAPKDPPLISVHVFDDGTDDCTYTIADWRKRFGAPGSGADVHGRQFGAYATED